MLRASVAIMCWLIVGVRTENLTFPPSFKFGVASSAYQVEGAWNASDKSESIWDHLLHTRPDVVADRSNGDVACDSYHLWKEDLDLMQELGMDMYRFSISWPRLLPNGFANYISEDGKKYYSDLIDGLLERGIEPVVTLYHWDLPQSLQDLGGWANPLIADWFADYARVVYDLYGNRVKTWLTMNEPLGICDFAYDRKQAPYLDDMEIGVYLCNKYVLIAHAKAWRIYDEEFKPKYHGKASFSTISSWFEPATTSAEDIEATEITMAHWNHRFDYPVYSKEGGWPPVTEKLMAEVSEKEGYTRSRLPPFSPEEIDLVKGTYDFYGLNYYLTRSVRRPYPGEKVGPWNLYGSSLLNVVMETDPTWDTADLDWFTVYPEGLYKLLHWIQKNYGVKEILITENGFLTFSKDLQDTRRVNYIKGHLEAVLRAMADGINITGYTVWSLMDNFEWFSGYSAKFGLYSVNVTSSQQRTVTPRDSARFMVDVIRTRSLYHV